MKYTIMYLLALITGTSLLTGLLPITIIGVVAMVILGFTGNISEGNY